MTLDDARREAAHLLGVPSNGRAPRGSASLKSPTAKMQREAEPAEVIEAVDYTTMIDQAHEALFLGTSAAAHEARAYLKHRGLDLANYAGALLRAAKVGVIDETVELPDNLKRGTYAGRLVFPYLEADGRALFFNARAAGDVDPGERFRKPTGTFENHKGCTHSVDVYGQQLVTKIVDRSTDCCARLILVEVVILRHTGHLSDAEPHVESGAEPPLGDLTTISATQIWSPYHHRTVPWAPKPQSYMVAKDV